MQVSPFPLFIDSSGVVTNMHLYLDFRFVAVLSPKQACPELGALVPRKNRMLVVWSLLSDDLGTLDKINAASRASSCPG